MTGENHPRYRAGVLSDDDRRRLVERHGEYVRALATRIREHLRPAVDLDDLVAYGTQGLLEAAERYDPRHGTRFTTFAYYRIRGSIFDGLRRMGWLTRGEYARFRFEERANAYLEGSRSAGDETAGVARAIQDLATIYVTSLDAMEPLRFTDHRADAQHDWAELGETRDRLHEALAALSARERRLIDLYYYGGRTLEEAGRELGLSKSWTSRLHARVIRRLSRMLRGEDAPPRRR